MQGIRRIIAERLTRSVRDIPQVTTFITLDATALLAFRDSFASGDARMSPLPDRGARAGGDRAAPTRC